MSSEQLSRLDPFELSNCVCANLRRATRVITQVYDAALQPLGLKATQFTLLATLAKCGDVPLTKLAEALVMDRTTLTRNLQPLAKKGWLSVEQGADHRERRVSLTEAGHELVERAMPLWHKAQEQMTERLGQGHWAGLVETLARTVTSVRAP